jgi:hypothetical protein
VSGQARRSLVRGSPLVPLARGLAGTTNRCCEHALRRRLVGRPRRAPPTAEGGVDGGAAGGALRRAGRRHRRAGGLRAVPDGAAAAPSRCGGSGPSPLAGWGRWRSGWPAGGHPGGGGPPASGGKPAWWVLEERGFALLLVSARHGKLTRPGATIDAQELRHARIAMQRDQPLQVVVLPASQQQMDGRRRGSRACSVVPQRHGGYLPSGSMPAR